MPTKAELYAQMADKVATQLTGSWQEWAEFLTTASRLYKYPFHEQLMIYAQRPDAHGGTVKVHGLFQIELLIEFFQLLRHRIDRQPA